MRYSILGFNQEKLLAYDISMNEILLLSYIYEVQASPKMEHTIKNDMTYTWLYHAKIQEDLPILNVSERQLNRYIKNLIDCGLIVSTKVSNDLLRGTKAYYGITDECEDLRYYSQDHMTNMTHENSRPHDKYDTSDSKLSFTNSKLNNTISKDIVKKPKKANLFDKCVSEINNFTDDAVLQDYLIQFLKMYLENSKENGIPVYTNTFKGKLNNLKKLSTDNYVQRKIVLQTLDNGWNGFYELKEEKTYKKKDVFGEQGKVKSDGYTEDDKAEDERINKEREKKGLRTKF